MLADSLHRFFFFLGTHQGELATRAFSLLLFSLITYMVVSEWLRTKEDELRFIALGFGALTLQLAIACVTLWLTVFGELPLNDRMLPVLLFGLELIGLLMLTNAFIYPFFQRFPAVKFLGSIFLQASLCFALIAIVAFAWGNSPALRFESFWGSPLLTLIGMLYLILAMGVWFTGASALHKYRNSIILAFFVYFVALALRLTNFALFAGYNGRFIVAEQPFPTLCALLFTRIVYLKLVDKATLQQRLAQSERSLEAEKRLGKLKDEFVSTVSHELRTPLTSIKLYASLLNRGTLGEVSPKQAKALTTIKEESDRLSSLIDDVLDLAKLEAGKAKLHLTSFDLCPFLHENIHYQLAKDKGINVKIHTPKALMVKADQPKIKQVIVNLLSNAIKFTEAKGHITLEAKADEHHWTLSISDTGKGIPKDKMDRLFTKFYQADSHMTRTQKGTGLGLAIAKSIVELHHGTIEARSEEGKGSTFTISIPLKP